MAFSITYKPLFQVNILHEYYLNKGLAEYASMSETDKSKQLVNYNFSNFFSVLPSSKSVQKLKGHNMVFKTSNTGLMVWTKVSADNTPFIELDDTLELTFLLKVNYNTFFNFSNLKFENVNKLFFFSNQRLSTEPVTFPMIKKPGGNTNVGDKYVLSDDGASEELKLLNRNDKANLFGLIKIQMKGQTNGLNVTTSSGNIRTPSQIFEMTFGNRKTIWRYIFDKDQTVNDSDDVKKEGGSAKQLITKQKQPLTERGFVSIEHGGVELPNPDAKLIKPNSGNNKIYSEIYM